MKAMIFAAGLGTRLWPITKNLPKALVQINNKPLLEWVIQRLKCFGVEKIIVNVHQYADQITNFLENKNNFGIHIEISDEREYLLDTGGGLKKASWFFSDNEPFIVHNVDVISDINFYEMTEFHKHHNSLVTLAVRNRTSSRYLLFNDENLMCGRENTRSQSTYISRDVEKYNKLAFSGIQIISPEIFHYIEESGAFSIVDLYLRLSKHYNIYGYSHDESAWYDVGRPEDLKRAAIFLKDNTAFQ